MQRDIAIVGMVCRVPGAQDLKEFWQLLTDAREGLRRLNEEELADIKIRSVDHYVAAGGFIDQIENFDADYFGLNAREAIYLDPQHRLWLQACWEALQIAGLAGNDNSNIGVYASAGPNTYLHHLLKHYDQAEQQQAILLSNVPDCLATRVSYMLNLTGPSLTVQCGCSSSLVALHHARLALLAKQCDAALVGGICISVPHRHGYMHTPGGFASPDGHCHPFSEEAAGTVFGSGYGVVVLKRLSDALRAGDEIYAVIKGSAINNDGADKASFTAPSVRGQAEVISKALRVANLSPNDIQYVECHGTATPIGDPIELSALSQAFKNRDTSLPITIGSVKANIGHLDVAAGIIGLIKTSLMLHYKKITPQINFTSWHPNALPFSKHFKVETAGQYWPNDTIRRAGISAFGFGGTNAHVILEEAPQENTAISAQSHFSKFIFLSEKSPQRLLNWCKRLQSYLIDHSTIDLSALAYSLQIGRKQLACRFLTKVESIAELISILSRVTINDFVSCEISDEKITVHDAHQQYVQAWLQGKTLSWQEIYSKTPAKKIALPAASLELQPYWYTNDANEEKDQWEIEVDEKQWLYQMRWTQRLLTDNAEKSDQPIILFECGHEKLSHALLAEFDAKGMDFIFVTKGDSFKKISEHHWQINPSLLSDYMQLEQMLSQTQRLPKLCIFNIATTHLSEQDDYPQNVIFNFLKLPKVLQHLQQVSMLTNGMSALFCTKHNPLLAVLIGLCRGIGQEYPNLKTQLVDLDPQEPASHVKQVIKTLRADVNDLIVVRDKKYWQQEFQLLPQFKDLETTSYFKKEGVYIITGGLGDVASVHVDYLAKEFNARLILLGRTSLPAENEWNNYLSDPHTNQKINQKIQRLKDWKLQYSNIHYFPADINDAQQLRELCAQCITQFGKIDGIIHIAGEGSDMHYKTLTDLNWQHCWRLLKPKIMGIETISTIADEFAIADCLIISSISSILTGIGLSAYGATHNVLDAIVAKYYPHFKIMNWDAWNFYQESEKQYGELGAQIDKLAITPEKGRAILQYAFTLPNWQQLFISAIPLQARYEYWAQRGFLKHSKAKRQNKHARPNLLTEYIAPNTKFQQQLADVWQNLLAIEKIGIHDSFFELGGHSLLALECIHSLREQFNYSCSVVDLFASPTIALLAAKMQHNENNSTDNVTSIASARAKKQLQARQTYQQKRE